MKNFLLLFLMAFATLVHADYVTKPDTLRQLACASGEVPKWNGTVWACAADNVGAGTLPSCPTYSMIYYDGASYDCIPGVTFDDTTNTMLFDSAGGSITPLPVLKVGSAYFNMGGDGGGSFMWIDVNGNANVSGSGSQLWWDGTNVVFGASTTINPTTGHGHFLELDVNSAYSFPTVDGTSGYVQKTNGSGTLTWQPDNDSDILAGLSCINGQIPKWNGSNWQCDSDNEGSSLPGGCSSGQIAKFNGSYWQCDSDNDTLPGLGCTSGQYAYHNGSNWTCNSGTGGGPGPAGSTHDLQANNGSGGFEATSYLRYDQASLSANAFLWLDSSNYIRSTNCFSGQYAYFDGSNWTCGSGGSGSPGGDSYDIQYNNGGGGFSGTSYFQYDGGSLTANGVLYLDGSNYVRTTSQCYDGQIIKWSSGYPQCGSDDNSGATGPQGPPGNDGSTGPQGPPGNDGVGLPSCSSNQMAWFNGSSWVCTSSMLTDGSNVYLNNYAYFMQGNGDFNHAIYSNYSNINGVGAGPTGNQNSEWLNFYGGLTLYPVQTTASPTWWDYQGNMSVINANTSQSNGYSHYFNNQGDTNWRIGLNIAGYTNPHLSSNYIQIQYGTSSGEGFAVGNNSVNAAFEIDNTGSSWLNYNSTIYSVTHPEISTPSTPASGNQIEFAAADHSLHVMGSDGVDTRVQRIIYSQTTPVTVANTTTETSVVSSGFGSVLLPADFFSVGRAIRLRADGFHSSAASVTIRIRVKYGSTLLLDTQAVTSGNDTDALIKIDGNITCISAGGSGSVWGQGRYEEYGSFPSAFQMVNTSAVTLDTTTSNALDITVEWGTASASDTITITNLEIESL